MSIAPNNSASNALSAAAGSAVELLEARRLLSASISAKSLNIAGTTKADTLTLTYSTSTQKVTVRMNSEAAVSFQTSKFQAINIATLAGNDTITLPSNLPATIFFMTIDGGLTIPRVGFLEMTHQTGPGLSTFPKRRYTMTCQPHVGPDCSLAG